MSHRQGAPALALSGCPEFPLVQVPELSLSDLVEDPDLQVLRRDRKLLKDMTSQSPDLITALYLLFHAPDA